MRHVRQSDMIDGAHLAPPLYGGAFSVAELCNGLHRACWSAFAELATNSVKALSGRLAYPPPLMPLLTQGGCYVRCFCGRVLEDAA